MSETIIYDNPRPVNNIKNYGAVRHGEEESIARFCRMVFAGAASARFHRPHPIEDPGAHQTGSDYGLGLSPKAQKIIQSMRWLIDETDFVRMQPSNQLLSDREDNEAYLLADVGKQYALYFPKGSGDGSVTLDLTAAEGRWQLKWLYVSEGKWLNEAHPLQSGRKVAINIPGTGHWSAVLLPLE